MTIVTIEIGPEALPQLRGALADAADRAWHNAQGLPTRQDDPDTDRYRWYAAHDALRDAVENSR